MSEDADGSSNCTPLLPKTAPKPVANIGWSFGDMVRESSTESDCSDTELLKRFERSVGMMGWLGFRLWFEWIGFFRHGSRCAGFWLVRIAVASVSHTVGLVSQPF